MSQIKSNSKRKNQQEFSQQTAENKQRFNQKLKQNKNEENGQDKKMTSTEMQNDLSILEDVHNPEDFSNRQKSLLQKKTQNQNDVSPTEAKKSQILNLSKKTQEFHKSPVFIGQTPQTMFDSESLSKNFCSIKQFQKDSNENGQDFQIVRERILDDMKKSLIQQSSMIYQKNQFESYDENLFNQTILRNKDENKDSIIDNIIYQKIKGQNTDLNKEKNKNQSQNFNEQQRKLRGRPKKEDSNMKLNSQSPLNMKDNLQTIDVTMLSPAPPINEKNVQLLQNFENKILKNNQTNLKNQNDSRMKNSQAVKLVTEFVVAEVEILNKNQKIQSQRVSHFNANQTVRTISITNNVDDKERLIENKKDILVDQDVDEVIESNQAYYFQESERLTKDHLSCQLMNQDMGTPQNNKNNYGCQIRTECSDQLYKNQLVSEDCIKNQQNRITEQNGIQDVKIIQFICQNNEEMSPDSNHIADIKDVKKFTRSLKFEQSVNKIRNNSRWRNVAMVSPMNQISNFKKEKYYNNSNSTIKNDFQENPNYKYMNEYQIVPFDQQSVTMIKQSQIQKKKSSIFGNSDLQKKQFVANFEKFDGQLILSGSSKKIKELLLNNEKQKIAEEFLRNQQTSNFNNFLNKDKKDFQMAYEKNGYQKQYGTNDPSNQTESVETNKVQTPIENNLTKRDFNQMNQSIQEKSIQNNKFKKQKLDEFQKSNSFLNSCQQPKQNEDIKEGSRQESQMNQFNKKRSQKLNRKNIEKQNERLLQNINDGVYGQLDENSQTIFNQIQQIKISNNDLQQNENKKYQEQKKGFDKYVQQEKQMYINQEISKYQMNNQNGSQNFCSPQENFYSTESKQFQQNSTVQSKDCVEPFNRFKNNQSFPTSIMDINFGETQQNLIRHQMLNPHLYKRGPTKYQKSQIQEGNKATKAKGHWTEEEDKKLTEAVRNNNGKNWKKIAESLEDRTDVQCLHRWQKVLNPTLVKGPWTDIEDRLLLHLVNIDGPQKWTIVANHLPGRIGKQCRERWHNHLNPMIKRNASWTREEEWILFLLNRVKSNKWADIANILEGRTDNTIKNHWNSSMKRRIKEYQQEFKILFQELLNNKGMNFEGSDPIDIDEQGNQIIDQSIQGQKIYSKQYITLMKQLENQLLIEKTKLLKEQNKEYYQLKCKELINNSENDSFCLAAANIMLNSGSQYVQDLREEFAYILEKNKVNNSINAQICQIDDKKISDIIDNICNSNNNDKQADKFSNSQMMHNNNDETMTDIQCDKSTKLQNNIDPQSSCNKYNQDLKIKPFENVSVATFTTNKENQQKGIFSQYQDMNQLKSEVRQRQPFQQINQNSLGNLIQQNQGQMFGNNFSSSFYQEDQQKSNMPLTFQQHLMMKKNNQQLQNNQQNQGVQNKQKHFMGMKQAIYNQNLLKSNTSSSSTSEEQNFENQIIPKITNICTNFLQNQLNDASQGKSQQNQQFDKIQNTQKPKKQDQSGTFYSRNHIINNNNINLNLNFINQPSNCIKDMNVDNGANYQQGIWQKKDSRNKLNNDNKIVVSSPVKSGNSAINSISRQNKKSYMVNNSLKKSLLDMSAQSSKIENSSGKNKMKNVNQLSKDIRNDVKINSFHNCQKQQTQKIEKNNRTFKEKAEKKSSFMCSAESMKSIAESNPQKLNNIFNFAQSSIFNNKTNDNNKQKSFNQQQNYEGTQAQPIQNSIGDLCTNIPINQALSYGSANSSQAQDRNQRIQNQMNTMESFGPYNGMMKTNNKRYYMVPYKQDSDVINAEENAFQFMSNKSIILQIERNDTINREFLNKEITNFKENGKSKIIAKNK